MTSGQILRILGNVSFASTATLVIACSDDGSSSNLDGNYFMCEGTYTKTNQAGTVLMSDGALVPDPYCGSNPATSAPKQNSICVCASSQSDAVSKCQSVLANGMTAKDPNDNSITWSYKYNVKLAEEANSRLNDKCSTQEQLASTSFALVGGPAEYSAALTGSVGLGVTVCIDYVVYTDCTNYSASSGLTGRVDYTVDGKLGSCPNTGCGFEMSRFMGTGGNLSISDTTVSGIDFANAGTIVGTVQNDGSIQLPANAFALTVNYDRNGNHNSTVWSNGQVLTGHLSSGGTVLTLDTISIQQGGTLTLSGLTATTTLAPPVVKINPSSATVECTSPAGAAVHLDGTATTGGNGQYFWKVDSGASMLTAGQFDATLAVGSHQVTLAVPNGLEGVGYATAPVNVVDTTPPTLTASNVTTVKVCDVSNVGVTLTPPTVTDVCTGVKQVTGRVVASNGQNLSQPIVLSNGKGSVPVGQHQVVWTATDNAGNAKSITQTISVIPSFYGTSGVYLPDGVVLKTKLSDRTPFANGFGGQAQLGVAATSGDIWSGGTVWLRDRAHVLGKVFSASTITTQNGVITDGLFPNMHPFYLAPPIQLSAAKPLGGPAVSLEPSQTKVLSPGSYGDLSVKSRATLQLSAGTYNLMTAMIEPDAIIQVTGNVTLVVANNFTYRGTLNYTGAGRLTIIYLGTNTAYIERQLARADYYSPSAKVVLGVAGINSYVGSITALQIEAAPYATVMCDL